MQEFILINKEEVSSLLDMKTVISAVEKAYIYKVRGEAELFPIVCHEFKGEDSEFDIKSGGVDGEGIFGMKLVSAFYGNDVYGLPRLAGTILIFDRKTGMLRGMMDGSLITNMRTGAAGAVGVKYLAREDSKVLLILGTGAQAMPLLKATLEVMPGIKQIIVANIHTPRRAEEFIRRTEKELETKASYEAVSNLSALEDAVKRSDIILTATPSRKALIKAEWVRPGTHLSCIGSDMEGKQELEESLTASARVFADDKDQVIAVGECEKPLKSGLLKPEDITEIGDVILGRAAGRLNDDDITIFDSTGIGLQDLMTAAEIIPKAKERSIGTILRI